MRKILLLALSIVNIAQGQKSIFTTAKVKSATVYFNAVELTHQLTAAIPAGTSEIIVKNVANSLNENTIQISAPAAVTILSVQFSNDNISSGVLDEKSPATKKIRDSIAVVTKELNKIKNTIASENSTIDLLDNNKKLNGQNTGLNVAELIKMVDYYKLKRTELSNNIDVNNEKIIRLQETINKLNDKLQDNSSYDESVSTGKLILQVMCEKAGILPMDISYLSTAASWTPFYDLRANDIASPINMIYKAQVTQYTGVDWKKVKLSLSSGMPNQNNQAPILNAWRLTYGNSYNKYGKRGDKDYLQKNSQYNQKSNAIQSMATEELEIRGGRATISDFTNINDNQLNVSFDIDLPYDILSNGKIHSVSLKEILLPVSYKYYAAPKVEREAFLLAELSDYSKYNLLRGEANIIFEGMYVGKTLIDPNQTTDTINLSMGRDKKISIKREKVIDKSGTKFLSAFKSQTFTFDITIRNNKKETINLLLKDQFPLSADKEIEIQLLQSDDAAINVETGILTWKIKLAPNENKKVRISYLVKYPKDKIIGNL